MPLKEPKYRHDLAILKDYNGQKYKLTLHRHLRTPGIEDEEFDYTEKGTVNEEKLDVNISRARSKIFEYAICNPWTLFCTFTIDPKKYDRQDLERYHKNLAQFIRNYNKSNGTQVKYLLIPEEHKKGGWHEHGLLLGLPESDLRAFELNEHIPKYIREKIGSGAVVYDWPAYRERFGFCDLEAVKNQEAVAKYVTKYITKDLTASIKELNAHLYYCSQGLEVAKEIKRGSMLADIKPDYENEYVKVQWFDKTSDLENLKNLLVKVP